MTRECREVAGLLDEAVDGSLPEAARPSLDQHLASCPSCRETLTALRLVRRSASSLPRLAPPPRVWRAIESQLAREQADARRRGPVPPSSWSGWWLAAAAMLTLAVGAAVTSLGPRGNGPVVASASEPSTWSDQVEAGYGDAIAQLEELRRSSDATLDPQVAVSLEASLAVVDRAIAESRSALQAGATSDAVRDGLHDALADKVSLLERAVLLLDESREGDLDAEPGAAPQQ